MVVLGLLLFLLLKENEMKDNNRVQHLTVLMKKTMDKEEVLQED